jgi:transposase
MMTQITINSHPVVIGVYTYKDTHAAVAINNLGARLDGHLVPATLEGYEQLLNWAKTWGQLVTLGVEGTGSYGSGLTRFLHRQGLKVVEVSRLYHRGQWRLQGKNDLLDTEAAARQVLAGQTTVTPKSSESAVEMIRILKVARDTVVKAQTQVMIALKAMIVAANAELRAQLEPLPASKVVAVCEQLEVGTLDTPIAAMRYALAARAKRWRAA